MKQNSFMQNSKAEHPMDGDWDSKDCIEVAKRTGFGVAYVRQVLIYNTRNHDGIWVELARVVRQREDAKKENGLVKA